ncbi:hypothetical protein DU508_22500 [Pedobacter chinensis]|uniref:Capsule assembly Wzi family protein n=1 Tax=Pedobacter chinensis TaxID=2282421 RepID=A0A369PPQ8_9SPHI|nr:capsule assembly Wzi family protein [Pedobacter chinensis]RDC54260.1 hypothetical protein DU508_22500 [Pedobacter chinensis]
MYTLKIRNISLGTMLLIGSLSASLHAQTLPVGLLENIEDSYRRQQLLGNDTSNVSYIIRPLPISPANNLLLGEQRNGNLLYLDNFRKELYTGNEGKIAFYLLPAVVQQQFNTHHPYGINDGSMVQAKGYQTQISAGVFAKIGPLSIQLRPEYVFADNTGFQKMSDANGTVFKGVAARNFYNKIDLPDRFGDSNYSKLSWGQSSISLNAGPVAVSLSNENLWWGPGVRNSLLMTNNASGFKHLSLSTTKPIKTYIGSFEAQIIGGRLEQSGIAEPTGVAFVTKPGDWRYFSGIALTYQPEWVPGFYLGLDRTFIVNRRDMGRGFADYFPIFKSLPKKAFVNPDGTNAEETVKQDQYISFFARYVLPESKAEVYLEYGRNDHAYDLRDAIVEPEHTRAYVAGFRKLVPLIREEEYIQVGMEFTQLQKNTTRETRASETWYTHYQVSDGYTNNGQVLGAGIGPGSNMQSLDVSWVKGLKKIGLLLERVVNNNDLLYSYADASGEKSQYINRHWIDLAFGGKFAWNFDKLIINSQLTYIRSLNYQYQWEVGPDYWEWNKKDVNNLHLKVGILYRW